MNFREKCRSQVHPPLQRFGYLNRRCSYLHQIPFKLNKDELDLHKEDSVSSIDENEPVINLSRERSQGKPQEYFRARLGEKIKTVHKTEVEETKQKEKLKSRLPFKSSPWPRIKRGKKVGKKCKKQVHNPEDIIFTSRDVRGSVPNFKCNISSIMKNKGGNLVGKMGYLCESDVNKIGKYHPNMKMSKKTQVEGKPKGKPQLIFKERVFGKPKNARAQSHNLGPRLLN
ncbi:unnamed protein product [Moneuplotes crassus]|uniref:Uncharacterized protein n=1 Tax=Euplotes crassus TaxID=5936 RepID=A0AAD1X4W2_EUPCR|nr:unnamed protein product [Moneuplotes crassus]